MTGRRLKAALFIIVGLVAAGVLAGPPAPAAAAVRHYQGQTVYVPVYAYIYYGNKPHKINLTATLSVRNTSLTQPIQVTGVRYVDSHGQTVREYVSQPVKLAGLGTSSYTVAESDVAGGVGASFIITWKAAQAVTAPVIEAVMISTASNQGISFVSPGRVIKEESR